MASIEADRAPSAEALRCLREFPLLDALCGRRSRRFGVGMEIPSGPLAFRSAKPSEPIGAFERTLLIALGAGVSGWNLGIPHAAHGNADGTCDYAVRPVGRTYPSGAAVFGSELLITDDSGSYMTAFRELDATALEGVRDPAALVEHLAPHIVRLGEERVEVPRRFPHVGSHNHWVANRPGSTLFVPISDQVDTVLNLIWIYTREGAPILDRRSGRPYGDPSSLLEAGVLINEHAVPLDVVEAVSLKHTTAEIAIAANNIQLALQAIGLGGWLFTGIDAASLLGAYASDGIRGFGFRFAHHPTSGELLARGLDGIFEPLAPPYVSDMREGARRFLERKFGPGGVFDPDRSSPFRKPLGLKRPAMVADYFLDLVQDIYECNGLFPVTIPAVFAGLYTQAHHIDIDFYDRYFDSKAYLWTHAQHKRLWHGS